MTNVVDKPKLVTALVKQADRVNSRRRLNLLSFEDGMRSMVPRDLEPRTLIVNDLVGYRDFSEKLAARAYKDMNATPLIYAERYYAEETPQETSETISELISHRLLSNRRSELWSEVKKQHEALARSKPKLPSPLSLLGSWKMPEPQGDE